MKKISVIITTFNGSKTISKTLDSVINQEGKGIDFEIELIVIDDCSTDETYSILQEFNLILLQNKTNSGGPNKGRNLGLRFATGDFICIIDQDDFWKKNRIKSILPYLDKAPIITCGYEIINVSSNNSIIRLQRDNKEFIYFEKNETFKKRLTKSLDGQNTYLASILFSNKLKHILFEEHFGMVDFDWLLRLFHEQTSIEVCKVLYERHVDGSNLSLNERYRRFDFYYSLLTIESYENSYSKETRIATNKIFGSRARYYYLIGNMKKARYYFVRSQYNLKTLFYYLTTYIGSKIVKKYFNVFG